MVDIDLSFQSVPDDCIQDIRPGASLLEALNLICVGKGCRKYPEFLRQRQQTTTKTPTSTKTMTTTATTMMTRTRTTAAQGILFGSRNPLEISTTGSGRHCLQMRRRRRGRMTGFKEGCLKIFSCTSTTFECLLVPLLRLLDCEKGCQMELEIRHINQANGLITRRISMHFRQGTKQNNDNTADGDAAMAQASR